MQALEALAAKPEDNILLAGDMNWNDDKDGMPQLSPGWWEIHNSTPHNYLLPELEACHLGSMHLHLE